MIKQISLFLENKKGRLAQVCRIIGDSGINIRALSIADTTDFGILRLIVNEPEKAYEVLGKKGFVVSMTDVLAIKVADTPGGLADVLEKLDQAGVNVEYAYAFIGTAMEDALVIIRAEKPIEALQKLETLGIPFLRGEKLYSL
ncbi:MAG: ACT domain-containing protein [Desulfocucumaceae bacterium]